MAFDRTDPVQLAELKSEVNTDPTGLGYDINDTNQILATINLKRATITVSKLKISAAEVRAATTFEAYDGLLVDRQEWLRWMTGSNGFDEDNMVVTPDLRVNLHDEGGNGSIWAVGERPEMNAAMLALMDVDGSRAEELWGFETTISEQDWFAARDS